MSSAILPIRPNLAGGGGAPSPTTVLRDALLADSPDFLWMLNDTRPDSTGTYPTAAVDSSTNTRNGTWHGVPVLGIAGVSPDTAGQGAYFPGDSTSTYVSLADAAWMDSTQMTACAIICPYAFNNGTVIDRDDGGAGSNRALIFRVSTSGKLEGITFVGGVNVATGATTLTVRKKYMMHVRHDSTTTKVYLNGVEDGTVSAVGSMGAIARDINIGRNGFPSAPFSGIIHAAAWYTSALTSGQILAHAAAAGF